MSEANDVKLRVGVEGADAVAKAAKQALEPWKQAGATIASTVGGAFKQVASDIFRTITVANTISFGKAIDDARKFREQLGRLSVTNGPVAQLRQQIDDLSKKKLIRESDIIAATKGLGRMTYDFRGAQAALGALEDEALATGETLQDKLPLGAALMRGMGVEGAKVGDELDRVRAISEAFGTSGGLLAAEDRLKAIADVLPEIGMKADADKAKVEAMVLALGNGLGKEAGNQAAAKVVGGLAANRRNIEREMGFKRGELSNADGTINFDKMLDATGRLQQRIRKQSGGDAGLAQLMAANLFGGDYLAGSSFLSLDVGAVRGAGKIKGTGATGAAGNAYRASAPGKATADALEAERKARELAEKGLPAADYFQSLAGEYGPLATLGLSVGGTLLTNAGSTALRAGLGALGSGAAGVAGGAGAVGALSATAGGLFGLMLGVPAAYMAGSAAGSYLDEATGASDWLAGVNPGSVQSRQSASAAAEGDWLAQHNRGLMASRAARVLSGTGSSPEALAAYLGPGGMSDVASNPYLSAAFTGATTGKLNTVGLDSESIQALAAAIAKLKLENQLQIITDTDHPITVNTTQSNGGLVQ